jgi:hypothetical protein
MSDDKKTRDLFKNSTLRNQEKVVSRSSELDDFRIYVVRSITSFIKRNIMLRRDKSISLFKEVKIIRLLMRQNKTEREALKKEDKCRIFQSLLREDEPARDIPVRDVGYEPSAKSGELNYLKTVYELQNSCERDEIERSLVCANARIE